MRWPWLRRRLGASCTSRAGRARWAKSWKQSRHGLILALRNPGRPSRRSRPGDGKRPFFRSDPIAVCAAKLPSNFWGGRRSIDRLQTGLPAASTCEHVEENLVLAELTAGTLGAKWATRDDSDGCEGINSFAVLVMQRPFDEGDPLRLCLRRSQADNLALEMQNVVRPHGHHPT